MITAIQYSIERAGVTYALTADKDVKKRNAYALKSVSGNGLPGVSTLGSSSYGLPGKSYNGLDISDRDIDLDIYANGYSPAGLQELLDNARRVASVADDETLGVLRLQNAAGAWYRIGARVTDMSINKAYRRAALLDMAFNCPQPYFESDTLHRLPLFAVTGGKEYPQDSGLERPYTFGNISSTSKDQTVVVVNSGDLPAPLTIKLFGAGLSAVTITNKTTGAQIVASGMSASGIEISTDHDNLYAVTADGSDASAYISLLAYVSDFVLQPGANEIRVQMTASSVTAAGTEIMWRERFSSCL